MAASAASAASAGTMTTSLPSLATTADTNLKPEVSRGSRSTGEGDVFLKNVEEISALFVDNADHALYTAKNSGRNQVMLSKFFPIPQNESRTIEIRS